MWKKIAFVLGLSLGVLYAASFAVVGCGNPNFNNGNTNKNEGVVIQDGVTNQEGVVNQEGVTKQEGVTHQEGTTETPANPDGGGKE